MKRGLTFLAATALATAIPVAAADSAEEYIQQSADLNYMVHCQGCHLADGSSQAAGIPALADTVGIFLHLPEGRNYLMRVPGSVTAPIDNKELAELLNWMIEEFGGESAPPNWQRFTEAEVASQRHSPLFEVDQTRANLLHTISQMNLTD